MKTVAVIDYGMGNLHSVAKALETVSSNVRVLITNKSSEILESDCVVFPGVGAIRDCMVGLKKLGLDEVLLTVASEKPLLGVCVGMQALMNDSEENEGVACLGLIDGNVQYFGNNLLDQQNNVRLKVPHMGWNNVHQNYQHPLWHGIQQDARFYFVHSYYVKPDNDTHTAASTNYSIVFAAAVAKKNIFAVQFHPEKSQTAGLALYSNFIKWDGTL